MEIKVIKIITGEDVISQFEDKNDKILLKNPQKFMITPEGIASIPLMPFSDDSVYEISRNHIIFICNPDTDIRNMYNSKYGNGVILPKSGKIELS